MKAFLRLKGKIRPRRKLSAVSYQSSALNGWQLIKYCALDKIRFLRTFLQSILVFVSCSAALAQESVVHTTPAGQAEVSANKATDTDITPLKIGDKIPDELWEMYFPVVSANSDEIQYLSLGDFKDKLIILDFWATWCAPCISSLHKLDTLQEQFKDDLMVIPASYEIESKIRPFLTNRKIDLPSLIEEKELKKYFPHESVPHQVWISKNRILAITSSSSATTENIKDILAGRTLNLKVKKEIKVDPFKPITAYIPENEKISMQSFMMGYIEGIGNTGRLNNDSLKVIYLFNRPILSMFSDVLRISNSHILLNVADTSKYLYRKDYYENIHTYHLIADSQIGDSVLDNKVINDLCSYFGLQLNKRRQYVSCLVLSDSDNSKPVLSRSDLGPGSFNIEKLIAALDYTKYWNSNPIRFVDESTYTGYFRKEILKYQDIEDLKEKLLDYGISLKEEMRALDFYIISEI